MLFATKSISAIAIVLFSLSSQALGHALIEPAIGVKGTGARSDVQRPSTSKPCGNVNIANVFGSSKAVTATNGAFTVNVQNFNGGTDGATAIKSATVNTDGTGKKFSGKVTITKNGVANPSSTGTVQVSGTLPSGTTCTGGAAGNQCLVSFTTNAGFGNCVLITQGGAGADKQAGNSTTTASAAAASSSGKGKSKTQCKSAGSRKAREIKVREAAGELFPRDGRNWVWAA